MSFGHEPEFDGPRREGHGSNPEGGGLQPAKDWFAAIVRPSKETPAVADEFSRLIRWTAPPPASQCAKVRLLFSSSKSPFLAKSGCSGHVAVTSGQPGQQTFEKESPLSHRFRLLHLQEQTFLAVPPFVWF
jgi:hypothetical protein